MSLEFTLARDIDLPSTPDGIWTAVTSGSAAWQFPTGLEIPTGATVPDGSPIATWSPPSHLVIRMDAPDGTCTSLEYLIEARAGGTAHLHYVHRGILADGWEDQCDAIGAHTDFSLHTLGEYLRRFAPRPVTYIGQPSSGIDGPLTAGGPDAMDVLRAALGIDGDGTVGDAVDAELGGGGALTGVVDYATPQFLGVATEDGLYRFFGRNHFGSVVGMSAHLFRDDVDAGATEAALKAWLDSVYA